MKKIGIIPVFLFIILFLLLAVITAANGQIIADEANGDSLIVENTDDSDNLFENTEGTPVNIYNKANVFDLLGEDLVVYTATCDSSLLESIYVVPNEILSSSTDELLEYFLDSPYMMGQVYNLSSFATEQPNRDYSDHPAFKELLTRDDLSSSIENVGASITGSDTYLYEALQMVVEQPLIRDRLTNSFNSTSTLLTTSQTEIGEYVATINGIDYYSASSSTTVSGEIVYLSVAEHELSDTQISNYNQYASTYFPMASPIHQPTAYYNCHSFAWYLASNFNPYWLNDISPFLNDATCTPVAPSDAQGNDIIIYLDSYNYVLHSAIIDRIDTNGNIYVISKWGAGGAYNHLISYAPTEYMSNPSSGTYSYAILRYHDYTNKFTGNEYHTGKQHFYEYADFCKICEYAKNYTWTSKICSGPPCFIPYTSIKEDEIS